MNNGFDTDDFRFFISERRYSSMAPIAEGMSLLNGRYKLGRFLGQGRHAVVFSAIDTMRGHEVALKVAYGREVDPEVAREVLKHESRIYSRIGAHPNVLRVHDLHFDREIGGGLLLLSMEKANDGTLAEWLMRHRHEHQYRVHQTKQLLRAMCEAILPVHNAGVRHLDLSINNFLFCGGVLKVADFGAARSLQEIALRRGGEVPPLGCSVCTPGYMAPEMLSAVDPDEVDHRADLFSIGCIAYQIAERECQTPFGNTIEEVRRRWTEGPPPPLREVEQKVARAVFKCLERI